MKSRERTGEYVRPAQRLESESQDAESLDHGSLSLVVTVPTAMQGVPTVLLDRVADPVVYRRSSLVVNCPSFQFQISAIVG
jgi:hypothetical protein